MVGHDDVFSEKNLISTNVPATQPLLFNGSACLCEPYLPLMNVAEAAPSILHADGEIVGAIAAVVIALETK
ncbi:MAG: hypothetical protein D6722_10025 [Bacteroidetes bacterium]|nr:MAG: hypothetical protein D6722_10025 [Bacteroidota bacterium]